MKFKKDDIIKLINKNKKLEEENKELKKKLAYKDNYIDYLKKELSNVDQLKLDLQDKEKIIKKNNKIIKRLSINDLNVMNDVIIDQSVLNEIPSHELEKIKHLRETEKDSYTKNIFSLLKKHGKTIYKVKQVGDAISTGLTLIKYGSYIALMIP